MRPNGLCRALALATLVCGASTPALTDTPAPGYQIGRISSPSFGAATTTLAGGDLVTWDGIEVNRWTATGEFIETLSTFGSFVFASFVVPTPDGTAVVIGNSSDGGIHEVALDGSGIALLARMDLNFDAVFENDVSLLVSAAACGFGCGNQIFRVNRNSGLRTRIANVAGPSGPIALDAEGNLYYATQTTLFPAPPGSSDILKWTQADIHADVTLTEADATVFSPGFVAPLSMAFDERTGKLYLAENDFGSGSFGVFRVGATAALSPTVASTDDFVGGLHFVDGGGPATFDPFQPSGGLNLRYATSDFFSKSFITTVAPKRPVLRASGPGTNGPGPITFDLTGGEPLATAILIFSHRDDSAASELSIPFPCYLMHTRLPLGFVQRVPFAVLTDELGNGSTTLTQSGGMDGFLFQYIIRNPAAKPVGSSTTVEISNRLSPLRVVASAPDTNGATARTFP